MRRRFLSGTGDNPGSVADDLVRWPAVVDAMGTLPVFDGLPAIELATMAQAFELSKAQPRQLLEVQDTPVRRWQVISAGHVLVQRDGVTLGLLGVGESWSEHSILNQHRSPISVVALSPVTTLSAGDRDLWAMVNRSETFRDRIVNRSATSADRLALPVLRALLHMEKAARAQPVASGPGW